jgi:hypothetical protein
MITDLHGVLHVTSIFEGQTAEKSQLTIQTLKETSNQDNKPKISIDHSHTRQKKPKKNLTKFLNS